MSNVKPVRILEGVVFPSPPDCKMIKPDQGAAARQFFSYLYGVTRCITEWRDNQRRKGWKADEIRSHSRHSGRKPTRDRPGLVYTSDRVLRMFMDYLKN